MPRLAGLLLAASLLAAACGATGGDPPAGARAGAVELDPGPAPAAPDRPLAPATRAAVDDLFDAATTFGVDRPALAVLGTSGDARLAWYVADLLRFFPSEPDGRLLGDAFAELTGAEVDPARRWSDATDHLLAWDLPAPPGYVEAKARLLVAVDERWAPFFDDAEADVDWREVSWGGVHPDDRELTRRPDGTEQRCNQGCIPALIDPATTAASGGSWLADDRRVFGLVVDGEARAYPVHQLEVHEMVHDTLGGRRVALAFCTLCRSAQAYLVDEVAPSLRSEVGDAYDLRTSGLLRRSNKLTYERATRSLIDTFTGRALSGPLREAGVELPAVPVVTSSWDEWRSAHPDTTIVAEDGGVGRDYPLDPLGGRDDAGPIFPIGQVDPRLPVQELVLGAVAPNGTAVAFPVVDLTTAREQGRTAALGGLRAVADGGGFRVETADGRPVASHEAFWFAWSQFHPGTELWRP